MGLINFSDYHDDISWEYIEKSIHDGLFCDEKVKECMAKNLMPIIKRIAGNLPSSFKVKASKGLIKKIGRKQWDEISNAIENDMVNYININQKVLFWEIFALQEELCRHKLGLK